MNCGLCGKECGEQYPCEDCGVLFYCSEKHRVLHCKHGHREECHRLAKQKNRDLPDTGLPFHGMTIEEDLDRILNEWSCRSGSFWETLTTYSGSKVPLWNGANLHRSTSLLPSWELTSEVIPCFKTRTPRTSNTWLCSWADYYSVRGIPATSPVALLLHFPLSLYFALLLRSVLAPLKTYGVSSGLNVWYLGIAQEHRILPLFLEIGSLLPEWNIIITFVGPDIPETWNGLELSSQNPTLEHCGNQSCSCCQIKSHPVSFLTPYFIDTYNSPQVTPNLNLSLPRRSAADANKVTLRLIRGLYHEVVKNEVPDLVFCSNAGLELYETWIPTIEHLSNGRVFSVFTDYTEEAVYRSCSLLRSLELDPKQTFVNPFRCPLGTRKGGLSSPCFSNGFGFVLHS